MWFSFPTVVGANDIISHTPDSCKFPTEPAVPLNYVQAITTAWYHQYHGQ